MKQKKKNVRVNYARFVLRTGLERLSKTVEMLESGIKHKDNTILYTMHCAVLMLIFDVSAENKPKWSRLESVILSATGYKDLYDKLKNICYDEKGAVLTTFNWENLKS